MSSGKWVTTAENVNWAPVTAIRKEILIVRPPDDHFNLVQYAEQYRISKSTASVQLARLVKSGKLLKVQVRFGRSMAYYYRAVESSQEPDPCPTAQKSKRTKKT